MKLMTVESITVELMTVELTIVAVGLLSLDCGRTTAYLIHIKITKYGQISMKYTPSRRGSASLVGVVQPD